MRKRRKSEVRQGSKEVRREREDGETGVEE